MVSDERNIHGRLDWYRNNSFQLYKISVKIIGTKKEYNMAFNMRDEFIFILKHISKNIE